MDDHGDHLLNASERDLLHGSGSPADRWWKDMSIIFFGALLIGSFYETLQTKFPSFPLFRLPYTVAQFLLGYILALLATYTNKHDDLNIPADLILVVLLPPLLLESSMEINTHIFVKVLKSCLLLAVPGVLLASGITAIFCKLILDSDAVPPVHDQPWDIFEVIILGTVLSATDPVAVVNTLKALRAPAHLEVLIEGESLLNDGSAFVLFEVVLHIQASHKSNDPHVPWDVLFKLLFLGPVVGIGLGVIASAWLSIIHDPKMEVTIVVATNYITFILCDKLIKTSGVLACVCLGLYMAWRGKYTLTPRGHEYVHATMSELAHWCNTAIFILAGYIVEDALTGSGKGEDESVVAHFGLYHWGSAIAIYVFLHLLRGSLIMMFYACLNHREWGYGLAPGEAVIVVYGGLRGAVGLALGLIIDQAPSLDQKKRDTMLFIISAIVLLTGVINGSTTQFVYAALKLGKSSGKEKLHKTIMEDVHESIQRRIREVYLTDPILKQSYWPTVQDIVKQSTLLHIDKAETTADKTFSVENYPTQETRSIRKIIQDDIKYFESDTNLNPSQDAIELAMYIGLSLCGSGHQKKQKIIEILKGRERDPLLQRYQALEEEIEHKQKPVSNVVNFSLTIISAHNVPVMDLVAFGGCCDPFIKIIARQRCKLTTTTKPVIQQTKVIKKTLEPVWNQTFEFTSIVLGHPIIIELYDKDVMSEEFIGQCALDIAQYVPSDEKKQAEQFTDDIKVISDKATNDDDILIKVTGIVTDVIPETKNDGGRRKSVISSFLPLLARRASQADGVMSNCLQGEGMLFLVFNALQAQYKSQFENGFITDDSIVVLLSAAADGRDFESIRKETSGMAKDQYVEIGGVEVMTEAASLKKGDIESMIKEALWAEFSGLLTLLHLNENGNIETEKFVNNTFCWRHCESCSCASWGKRRLYVRHLYKAIESLGGYIRAHEKVVHSIQNSVDFARKHQNAVLNTLDHIVAVAKKVLLSMLWKKNDGRLANARSKWEEKRIKYEQNIEEEKAIACLNYIASRFILAVQRERIEEMSEEGMLLPEWEIDMQEHVENTFRKLPKPYKIYKTGKKSSCEKRKAWKSMRREILEVEHKQTERYIKKFFFEDEKSRVKKAEHNPLEVIEKMNKALFKKKSKTMERRSSNISMDRRGSQRALF